MFLIQRIKLKCLIRVICLGIALIELSMFDSEVVLQSHWLSKYFSTVFSLHQQKNAFFISYSWLLLPCASSMALYGAKATSPVDLSILCLSVQSGSRSPTSQPYGPVAAGRRCLNAMQTISRYGGKNRQQTPRRVTSLWHQCETDGAN